MIRAPLILAIGALALSACRDDHTDTATVTPTPTPVPGVTPTPTPSDGSTDGTDNSGSGGSVATDTGAAMASASETVGVISLDSTEVVQSLLTVSRSNGEIWEFEIPGIPTTLISTSVIYRNPDLVFGAVSGEIVFDDGTFSTINSSTRIQ